MSANTILVIIGLLLVLMGVTQLAIGFGSKNIGPRIGGTNTPTHRLDNFGAAPATAKSMPDWVGLTITAIGLVTALLGLLNI
jgi:hypothetical protein